MRKFSRFLAAGVVTLALGSHAQAQTTQVGSAVADGSGAGTLDISMDCAQDADAAADQLRANLQLSSGAEIESVNCADQSCSVEFTSAEGVSTVDGTMPTEIASALCAGGAGAVAGGEIGAEEQPLVAAGDGGTGSGTNTALVGVAAVAGVTGAILGGIALSESDDDGGGGGQVGPPGPPGPPGAPPPGGGPFIPRSPSQ